MSSPHPPRPTRSALGAARSPRVTSFALAVVCGVGAFAVNFNALSGVAATHGVPTDLAWVWAVVVDLTIVAGTVAHLALPRRVFVWTLFMGAAAFSVGCNTIHGLQYGPVGVAVAVFPPVALLAVVHLCAKLTHPAATNTAAHPTPHAATADSVDDVPPTPDGDAVVDELAGEQSPPLFSWAAATPGLDLTAEWVDRFPPRDSRSLSRVTAT